MFGLAGLHGVLWPRGVPNASRTSARESPGCTSAAVAKVAADRTQAAIKRGVFMGLLTTET